MKKIYCYNLKNICYLQIPKCANTSIVFMMLSDNITDHNSFKKLSSPEQHKILKKHRTLYDEGKEYKNKIFTFVRNPYKRIFSAWNDKVRLSERNFSAFSPYGITNKDSFYDFLLKIENISDENLNDHIRSQEFVAKHVIKNNGFIGKVEDISKDIKYIEKISGLKFPKYRFNSKNSEDYKEIYSEVMTNACKEIIYKKYKLDFDLFGYKK